MSQNSDHSADRAFFRTFGMVIGGLAAAGIVFGIIAVVFTSQGYTVGKSKHFILMTGESQTGGPSAEEPLQPVGETNVAPEPKAQTVAAASGGGASSAGASSGGSGQQVFQQVCAACHANAAMHAALGAPQVGKKEQWKPRAEAGLDTLVQHALQGYGKMPPQKGAVSEAEARAAIKYMVVEKTGIELK